MIWRIALTGGEPEAFTSTMEGVDLKYPDALPNGSGLLLTMNRGNNLERSGIGVVGPEGGEVRELFSGAMARYAESGHIVYTTADGTLMAAPFDLKSLQATGPSVAVLEDVMVKRGSASHFALSETGTLAYIAGETTDLTLAWYDRQGQATPLSLPPASYLSPALVARREPSPRQRSRQRFAVNRSRNGLSYTARRGTHRPSGGVDAGWLSRRDFAVGWDEQPSLHSTC